MKNRPLKTYVFYCSKGLEQDNLVGQLGKLDGIKIQAVCLPCAGKIDIPYLMKAFETGADGVVIAACKQNECLHVEGTARAQKRAEAVESLLEEIGMGKGRMAVIQSIKDNDKQAISKIRDFCERIKELPRQKTQSVPSL